MRESFGSDAFFLKLKRARASGDRQLFETLVIEMAASKAAMLLRTFPYSEFTREDREDAQQETVLYVLSKMDGFMDNPLNDPESGLEDRYSPQQRQAWFIHWIKRGLNHYRDKMAKHSHVDSLDREFSDEDGGSLMDITPAKLPTPEQSLLLKERLADSFRKLFSLRNAPELLAAVGYMLLEENLLGVRRSLTEYADLLNGMRVGELFRRVEDILAEVDIAPSVLAPLRARAKDPGAAIEGLNPRNMANRKNSILTIMRTDQNEED